MDIDLLALIIGIVVFLMLWARVSIPLCLATKVVTDGGATLGAATLGAP